MLSALDRIHLACIAGIEAYMNCVSVDRAVREAFADELELRPTEAEQLSAIEAIRLFKGGRWSKETVADFIVARTPRTEPEHLAKGR